MILDLEQLMDSLQQQVETLEQGRNDSSTVDAEVLDQLSAMEKKATNGHYELSQEDALKVHQLEGVYAKQIGELDYRQSEHRVEAARRQKDLVTLYLFREHSPYPSLRALASSLGTDTATLTKINRVRSLRGRAQQLQAMPDYKRRELARGYGYQVPEAPQQSGGSSDPAEHYRALKASNIYSF